MTTARTAAPHPFGRASRSGRRSAKRFLLLRARIVVPVVGPVIPDGAVLIHGDQILEAGRWRDLRSSIVGDVLDVGETALMPGLVNAHCHLDYTDMAGHFPPPRSFADWLKQITEAKAGWERSDYRDSWLNGAGMLLQTGTTTVADIEAVPDLLPEVWAASPLRVLSFLEMIGVTLRRTPAEILNEALGHMARLQRNPGLQTDGSASRPYLIGLSPHAPYSTLPSLLGLVARTARRRRLRVMTHVAESATEFEMFTRGRGEMHRWLSRSTRDMSDCDGRTPVEHLEATGLLGPWLTAIHANYVRTRDALLLGKRGVSVVHCPRSHEYFGHEPFPLRRLTRAGVNVCLGTDSLASVLKQPQNPRQIPVLSMFQEMRTFSRRSRVAPRQIVRMATVNGATALGMQGRIGQISPGSLADLVAVPFQGKTSAAYEGILEHEGPVVASLIGGRWALAPASLENSQ